MLRDQCSMKSMIYYDTIFIFMNFYDFKLTVTRVKSWVQPRGGFVLVIDVVDLSFWGNSLLPTIRKRTWERTASVQKIIHY